jgi:hypothetical protein
MTPEAYKEKLLKRIKRGQLTLKRCGQTIDALITKLEHTRIQKDRVKWKLEHNELELVDLMTCEDKLFVIETAVGKMTKRSLITEAFEDPEEDEIFLTFPLPEASQYRVGDRIRLEYRFTPHLPKKWEVTIAPPPERSEIHELVGYDS